MDKKKKIKSQMSALRKYTDKVANKEMDHDMEMKKAMVLKRLRAGQDLKVKKKKDK